MKDITPIDSNLSQIDFNPDESAQRVAKSQSSQKQSSRQRKPKGPSHTNQTTKSARNEDPQTLPGTTPELVVLAHLVKKPPFSTFLPIDPETQADIQEDMRVNGADHSQPIHVWRDGNILTLVDGFTRVTAAEALGVTALPAFIHDFADETAGLDFAYRCQVNRRNIKDPELLILVRFYDEKIKPGSDQNRIGGRFVPKASDDASGGKSAAVTADALHTSTSKVERTRRVIENGGAEILRKVTDGKLTINAAVNEISRREKRAAKPPKAPPVSDYSPLDVLENRDVAFAAWNVLASETATDAQDAKFKVAEGKRDIAFKAKLLKRISKDYSHRRVLVSPEIDLFAPEVPTSVIREVLTSAASTKDCEFLFTTRNPARLSEFTWGRNMFAGASIFERRDVQEAEKALAEVNAERKWLFIEQLTMELPFERLEAIDWVVVKTRSELPKATPTPEAMKELLSRAWAAGCPVFFDATVAYRPLDPPRPLEAPSTNQNGKVQ